MKILERGILYTKREFLSAFGGAGAAALVGKAAHSQLTLTGAGPASSGGAVSYNGFASTKTLLPTNFFGSPTDVNTRSGHWARSNLSSIQVKVPNFYGQSETAPGATMNVFASLEYPAGTVQQLLFSSSAMGTAPNGGWLDSDVLVPSTTIPCGDRYWIRFFFPASGMAGFPYIASGTYNDNNYRYMGDAFDFSSTDLTMMGSVPVPPTYATLAFYPTIVTPTISPTILMLGDSNFYGVTDLLDVFGDLGILARSVGRDFGYANWSQPGETAAGFISNHTNRILGLSNCTHVFCGWIDNDAFGGASAATIEADLTTIYGLCSAKTVYQATTPPRTTSTDMWATTGNQTVVMGETARAQVNTDLRMSFGPPGGVVDPAIVVETTTKWTPPYTEDGIHYDNAACLAVVAANSIDPTMIGTPASVTSTGSAWGDHGTKVTLNTLYRANDLAYPNTTGNPNTTARGAGSNSTGLKYFEFEQLADASIISMGLMTNATATGAGLDDYCGNITDSFGVTNGAAYAFVSGTIFTATSPGSWSGLQVAGSIWGWAVDFTNKFAYLHYNGIYFLSGNPTSGATGTGHVALWTGTPTLFPGMSMGDYTTATQLKFWRIRTVEFQHALPSGYTAWG